MKQLVKTTGIEALSKEEANAIVGGDDVVSYLKCVSGAMTSGGGGLFKSFVLGVTVFGMARMVGVMVGCSSI